ncbi:hypothetical protein [Flavobacterium urocaniciphilum]|uniref:Uncharacterized protein n=1 Tax=Flavobacterium urocaniciphilum TaxID=1299341 RepID=A0A1H9BR81_9FLAO|nr:hypothetical protein [Flavobacterium urocaniciphilum]SEP91409.1 hypothetical protein SAMN05444005_103161 [Flavobacterium urocaniciphilum]
MSEIKDLQNTLDVLLLEVAKNNAHLQTLTIGLFELSQQIFDEDKSKVYEEQYYRTLIQKTQQQVNRLGGGLYNPAKADFALFEFEQFLKSKLKEK